MKMKSYRAPDMRQALALIRDAQGPDAVILSSKRIAGGVEVVAAVDYDPDVSVSEVSQAPAAAMTDYDIGRESYHSRAAQIAAAMSVRAQGERPVAQPRKPAAESFAPRQKRDEMRSELDELVAGQPAAVGEELRTLRQMLETQFATLAWNDLSRRAPVQIALLKQLTELGLASDLASELVAQMPGRLETDEAQRLAIAQLSRRIATMEERWLDHGGIVAMVGPTGVGKTTLIAKLAARWVMRHGARSLALISADSVRIGAQEQIHTLGRLLGVPAYGIESVRELPQLLDHLTDKRLVLIDTAGLSQRDERLRGELMALASAHPRLESTLVLSGAAQAGAIEEAVERFSAAAPQSCVLTKLDEATSLGGAISTLIRAQLPLAYLSDGQRVPEDLSAARAHQLVARAVQLSRKAGATADEDLLQRRFGAVAHVMA
ncbi:MAG TPA: flagellar biosynthesis protein FlhF [Povalibacter sp.]|mgnify:CR=1 FL=1|uniref:flagellar biosynthesis protein FlhF n=1 Tax=Povalibacter sp. TaxID=1962978 RepID=UPI002C73EC72|nr:flagellar biosynthesis protein FlhF [Povalibacter sp.]HMN44416.1 flagellar biosynthesis protein FlhF [Povalibacter sp.]